MKGIFVLFLILYQNSVYGQDSGIIQSLHNTIEFLSSDDLNGRLAGSTEEQVASEYILKRFQQIGLKSYIQPFEAAYQAKQADSMHTYSFLSRNVVGYLDNHATVTILVGAHYDHIGRNQFNLSREKHSGSIHNGADDNASGVSAVLALAEMFASNSVVEKTNFLFVCFSAEELGLLGSKYFVSQYHADSSAIYAMINMDMIGRLDSVNTLYIGGLGTGSNLEERIHKYNTLPFLIKLDSSGIGPSDHTSFYLAGIPVLFFHTGSHDDYHMPSDDMHKINWKGTYQIVRYLYPIILDIGENQNVVFQRTAYTPKSSTRNHKVSLGIMPEYDNVGKGLKISGVIKGRIADIAGLQAGDIIVRINDCPVEDIYNYMDCLSHFEPGDTIHIHYKRSQTYNSQTVKL
jgi:hypothetical protein